MIADGFFFGLGLAAAGVVVVVTVVAMCVAVGAVFALLDWVTRRPR